MSDALHLTKFANFGRRCPVHAGARNWFSAARGLPKAVLNAPTHTSPHTTGYPHVSRTHVCVQNRVVAFSGLFKRTDNEVVPQRSVIWSNPRDTPRNAALVRQVKSLLRCVLTAPIAVVRPRTPPKRAVSAFSRCIRAVRRQRMTKRIPPTGSKCIIWG
jgi:hypothetical protein